jgi:hypothetical protein
MEMTMREARQSLEDLEINTLPELERALAVILKIQENLNPSNTGGFEQQVHILARSLKMCCLRMGAAGCLLDARIYGQLRDTEHVPEYDKPLRRC